MTTYLFWVTIVVEFNNQKMETQIMRGCAAKDELKARRRVLNKLLASGYQVRRLDVVMDSAGPL